MDEALGDFLPVTNERPSRLRWGILACIAVLFLSFSVAVAWQLVKLYGQLNEGDARRDTLGLLAQAQREGEKLVRADVIVGQGMIDTDAVVLGHRALAGLLGALGQSPHRERLQALPSHDAVFAAIDLLRPGQGGAGAQPGACITGDIQSLHMLTKALSLATQDILLNERDGRMQQLGQFGKLVRAAFIAFAVVLLSGGALIWQLMRSLALQREQMEVIAQQRDAFQDTVIELDRAQRATETYRDFVSLVSHQFRTPLAVIDSTAQRLMRSARSTGDSGFAESQLVMDKMHLTRSTVVRLNKLIDSVLTSVKLESGSVKLQTARVNLSSLVGEVVAGNAHLLQERPLLLETTGAADAYFCMGDAVLLEHVLQNLLSNACKYTQPGVAIAVTLSRVGYGTIVCTVRDWGEGVPESELLYLFERFYRSHHSSKAEGTGLGLYLARSIARLHGGNLDAHLPEGGGLAVNLRLPAIDMRVPDSMA